MEILIDLENHENRILRVCGKNDISSWSNYREELFIVIALAEENFK